MQVHYQANALAVLRTCDVVIQDGSLAGISAALAAAQAGKSVVLVEPRTYLGREMTACLRPWLDLRDAQVEAALPRSVRAILTPSCCRTIGDELIFSLDQVKIALEDYLLRAGVELLYASRVIDLVTSEGGLQGVVIANKSCRQVIRCQAFLNYEGNSSPGRLPYVSQETVLWQTLEFSGVDLSGVGELPAPGFLGVRDGRCGIHPGFSGAGHWYVEFPLAVSRLREAGDEFCQECERQRLTAQTVEYLLHTVAAMDGAYWAGASFESCLGAQSLVEQINRSQPTPFCWLPAEHLPGENEAVYGVSEFDAFARSGYDRLVVPARDVQSAGQVDVLVVGGGSSGASAAISAAENGMHTLLVEMNPRLGGTGTLGGVNSYWYGREAGFTLRLSAEVEAAHRELCQPLPQGDVPKWNIEAKAWALLRMARRQGVRVLLNSQAIGTVMDGKVVRGVVFSTPHGVCAVEANMVIDASGDGDLAVFSGAKFTVGAERTGATMWYSLAQFSAPGQTRNNFTSMLDPGNIEDYTRAILSGRRRGSGCVEHGLYLAARESRQVVGEALITLTGQLRQRQYEDVIQVAYSNYDVKGHTDSDWLRVGLIPPNLEIETPLGALIPQGIDHLLVAGKAISATHDALPSIRMQRDVENMGHAAGVAAALAIARRAGVRAVPVGEIQQRLVADGSLPPEILTRTIQPTACDVDELLQRMPVQPLTAYADMDFHQVYRGVIPFVELCCAGEGAIPRIRRELRQARGQRAVLLAQVLAMMGDAGGIEELIEGVQLHLEAGRLPGRSAAIRNTQLPPDQGAMPEVVYWLYSLGMLGDERTISVWEQVAQLLQGTSVEDFYSQTQGTFYYIDAVCYGVERLGSLRGQRVLQKLYQLPYLRNRVCRQPIQIDFVEERMAFLGLVVARAMLQCGMREGLAVLINYLEDARASLRRQAYSLLTRFTGVDLGWDADEWRSWVQAAEVTLATLPDRRLTDAQAAW